MNTLTKPFRRFEHSMVSDSTAGKIILFGWLYHDCLQDGDIIIFPGYLYYSIGSFELKLTSFGGIYNILGNFTWTPPYLPEGTGKSSRGSISEHF